MTFSRMLSLVLMVSVVVGCSSTKWIHPTKKEDSQLAADQMACDREYQNMMIRNPGVASMHTNQTITRQRIAACLYNKGWREVEEK